MFDEGHYKPPAREDFVSSFPMGLGKPWWKPCGSLLEYHMASTPLISPVWSPEERPTKLFSPYVWLKFAYYHRAIKHGLLVPQLVWWFSQLHPFTWGLPSGLPSSMVGHIYIYYPILSHTIPYIIHITAAHTIPYYLLLSPFKPCWHIQENRLLRQGVQALVDVHLRGESSSPRYNWYY